MLRGRFGDTTGRPYLEGRLILPRLNLRADISFLVDTGADSSLIHPADGAVLGLDYSKLDADGEESVGVGGICRNFIESGVLLFTEYKRALHVYNLPIAIAPSSPDIMDLPSLLGRDVLDNWRMIYEPLKDRLTFTVMSADLSLDLR